MFRNSIDCGSLICCRVEFRVNGGNGRAILWDLYTSISIYCATSNGEMLPFIDQVPRPIRSEKMRLEFLISILLPRVEAGRCDVFCRWSQFRKLAARARRRRRNVGAKHSLGLVGHTLCSCYLIRNRSIRHGCFCCN